MFWKLPVLAATFFFWFFLTTVVLSAFYPLDQAPICFAWEGNC